MAALSHQESRRRYSWWWDSHISPKNSRWLQENLTGMDSKVKQMIKLIEEDADSFARRADMYYKRRPELMRLVEEFYRAYRALAERYDHATGVIRHAHKTMVEAFPDQVPSMMNDDVDPNNPFMPPSVREFFDPDELQKDALGLSSPDAPVVKRNGLKQLDFFEKGRVRKSLNFKEAGEKEKTLQKANNNDASPGGFNDSVHSVNKYEADISLLKESLAKLEAEKEAGLAQYQKSLEKLSTIEKEIMLAQEDSRNISEQASKAEAEVKLLNGALIELKAEKEVVLLQYQQCLDKINILEDQISRSQLDTKEANERADRAENEVQILMQKLALLQAEKEEITAQHKQCSETITVIETKLLQAEENARRTNERAEMAESKVENLKLAIIQLTEEKEAYSIQCQQYLERISTLEFQILFSQEEAQRLNEEINNGVAKLKGAEEHCLSIERSHQCLQSELDSLMQTMQSKNKELTEKQMELGRLWTCVQEERLRFVEAETAFQTLQHLHSESQEEMAALTLELQNRAQTVMDLELRNHSLQKELVKIKEENRSLNELTMSSTESLEDMKAEILTLRETTAKLQEAIEERVHERNALQQEIYCLQEEFNELKQKHGTIMEQMESLELDPESFGLSVKELQDNNLMLSDNYQSEKTEKVVLLEKLAIMTTLIERNAALESSIADLNAELQDVKEKMKTLEESCRLLVEEKSALFAEKQALQSEFQVLTAHTGTLTEKNSSLEKSLLDANAELEILKEKASRLEESLLLIRDEKTGLLTEREVLSSKLALNKQKLEDIENRYDELEGKYSYLAKEKQLLVCNLGQLRDSLDLGKQEHSDHFKLLETRLASLECQLHSLKKETLHLKIVYDEELDKSARSEMEISILKICLQELEQKNTSLGLQCHKLFEVSQISEKLISQMGQKNADQQLEFKALYDELEKMRMGLLQVSQTLGFDVGIDSGLGHEGIGAHSLDLNQILKKIEEIKNNLSSNLDENQQLLLEKSVLVTLLGQLRLEAAELDSEKCTLSQNLKSSAQKLLRLLGEAHILLETNEDLKRTIKEGDYREEMLRNDIGKLNFNLLELQGSLQTLQKDKKFVLHEKNSLAKELSDLKDVNCALEEEIYAVLVDAVSLSNIFLVFKNFFSEKALEAKELDVSIHQLHAVKNTLEEIIRNLEGNLEMALVDNSRLMKSLEKSENELELLRSIGNQLNNDIENGKDLLHQKDMELGEAKVKLESLLNEQTELQRTIDDLKVEYLTVKALEEKQAEQILDLFKKHDQKVEENLCLRSSKERLEIEIVALHEKYENVKTRAGTLDSEVIRSRNQEALCEKEFVDIFRELQVSVIHEACYQEKFQELSTKFENLIIKSSSEERELQLLKEGIMSLEVENAGLKAQFSQYNSAVNSLTDSVASLESQRFLNEILSKTDRAKDAGSATLLQHEDQEGNSSNAVLSDGYAELKSVQGRIKAIEHAVEDIARLAAEGSSEKNMKAEAAFMQDEGMESGCSLPRVKVGARGLRNRSFNASSEITELPKDIMLDQISECSSYGLSRRDITGADDQMLELWGTTSKESSMHFSDARAQKLVIHRRDISSSEIVAEKELVVVDKLEISRSSNEPQQKGKKVKILERLEFDAQKLADLQKTVQDLRSKVEVAEKSKKTKGVIEYDILKEQLEEAEEAIEKLLSLNDKLNKTVQEDSISSKSMSENGSDESATVRRKRVLEQIRRASEKVSRLHFEVQKLQFLLVKLENEKEDIVKTRIIPRSPRVRLRDYLYGSSRPVFAHKQKRRQFCGCIRPPTKGD